MMKRAVFNAVGKVMGNENLGKVIYMITYKMAE